MGSDTKREDLAFDARFRDCRDELKWLFMELYDDAGAFDYFCGMLLRSYQQRKAALRELDRRRAAEPAARVVRLLRPLQRRLDRLLPVGDAAGAVHLVPLRPE